jgi:fatty acid synthase, animal type
MEAGGDGLKGVVKWECNWVSFLDSLIQIPIIADYKRSLKLPTAIQNLVISPRMHTQIVQELNPENNILSVEASRHLNIVRCGGVEMRGLETSLEVRRKSKNQHLLQFQQFLTHLPTPFLVKSDALSVLAQLALENLTVHKVKAIEMDFKGKQPIIPMLYDALKEFPLTTSDMMFLSSQTVTHHNIHVEDGQLATQTQCTFIIAGECFGNVAFTQALMSSLSEGAFIISREKLGLTDKNLNVPTGFQLLVVIPTEDETLVLLQQQRGKPDRNPKIIKATTEDYSWLVEVRDAMKMGPVIVLEENEKPSGIIEMVNCLRNEPNGQMVCAVVIDDLKAPPFELEHPLYKNHLKLGLVINIFKDVSIRARRLTALEFFRCDLCISINL